MSAQRETDGSLDVYASWNGTTRIHTWQALTGANPEALTVVISAPKRGFETRIHLPPTTASTVAVQALDTNGTVLATSTPASL